MTVQGIIDGFSKSHPDRIVDEIFLLNKREALVEAHEKGKAPNVEPNSFVVNVSTGDTRFFNPMDNLDTYTKAHNPKRRIYSRY